MWEQFHWFANRLRFGDTRVYLSPIIMIIFSTGLGEGYSLWKVLNCLWIWATVVATELNWLFVHLITHPPTIIDGCLLFLLLSLSPLPSNSSIHSWIMIILYVANTQNHHSQVLEVELVCWMKDTIHVRVNGISAHSQVLSMVWMMGY